MCKYLLSTLIILTASLQLTSAQIIFEKRYDWATLFEVKQISDSGFIIIGQGPNHGSIGALILKTNNFGDTIWSNVIGDSLGIDNAASGCQTNDGGFIICGLTDSYGAGNDDVFLI